MQRVHEEGRASLESKYMIKKSNVNYCKNLFRKYADSKNLNAILNYIGNFEGDTGYDLGELPTQLEDNYISGREDYEGAKINFIKKILAKRKMRKYENLLNQYNELQLGGSPLANEDFYTKLLKKINSNRDVYSKLEQYNPRTSLDYLLDNGIAGMGAIPAFREHGQDKDVKLIRTMIDDLENKQNRDWENMSKPDAIIPSLAKILAKAQSLKTKKDKIINAEVAETPEDVWNNHIADKNFK